MKRFLWLGFVSLLFLICTGCGDTFRPIIIPNPPTYPNPAAAHSVLTISDNAPPAGQPETALGSAMVIDVSGDADVSEHDVGLSPVHAVQQTANQVLVVNHSVSGAQDDSLTRLIFSGTTINNSVTLSLPPNSFPNFVAIAPNDTTAYVTLPNYVPDPINHPGVVVPSIGAVNTNTSLVGTAAVGINPVAVAVTTDNSKLYVANQGDGTLSAFTIVTSGNTVSLTPRIVNGALTQPPIWLVARTDNQRVYVLEQSGLLDSIDTTSTAGPDQLTPSAITVPRATTMVYDSNKNRLYITGGNPGAPQLAIVDVSQSSPQPLATISIPPFALLNLPAVAATAAAATVLPDESRAYAASYAVLPSQLNITAVSGDVAVQPPTATYAYTLTSGRDLTPGVSITVTGTAGTVAGFDGTFLVSAVISGTAACPGTCFQTPNPTDTQGNTVPVSGSGSGSNIFPQVTVVDVKSNQANPIPVPIPGFPDATNPGTPLYYVPVCATTRFRFMMAAAGDSTRAYLSSCDGGNVNFINTSNGTNTYLQSLPAPLSGSRLPIPPSSSNPPQNPVFLFAGP